MIKGTNYSNSSKFNWHTVAPTLVRIVVCQNTLNTVLSNGRKITWSYMNVETYKLQSNGFFSFTSLIVKIPKGHDWLLYKIGPSLEYAGYDPPKSCIC